MALHVAPPSVWPIATQRQTSSGRTRGGPSVSRRASAAVGPDLLTNPPQQKKQKTKTKRLNRTPQNRDAATAFPEPSGTLSVVGAVRHLGGEPSSSSRDARHTRPDPIRPSRDPEPPPSPPSTPPIPTDLHSSSPLGGRTVATWRARKPPHDHAMTVRRKKELRVRAAGDTTGTRCVLSSDLRREEDQTFC